MPRPLRRIPTPRAMIVAPQPEAVEAGVKQGWERFIGEDGAFIGMTGFGASAPAEVLYEKFGITSDAIVAAVKARL